MSTRFETAGDLKREDAAMAIFANKFNLDYVKLGENDVDFQVNLTGRTSYVEVKGRNRNLEDSFPLPLAQRKMVKLADKDGEAVVIWDCYDCIIYGNIKRLEGEAKMGGRKPRKGSSNDLEPMLYFGKQDGLSVIMK